VIFVGLISKNVKPRAEYHQWGPSDMSNGDILGVYESLGHIASTVTIESVGGASTIRFNVTEKVYSGQDIQNPWIPDAGFWTRPVLVDEVEVEKDDVVIESGSTHIWKASEIDVHDIKIISKSSGLKITVT
jgi:hypothetical protein